MSQLFLFFNVLSKVSLLSIFLVALGCSSKTEPKHDHAEMDPQEENSIDEDGEPTSAEDTTVLSDSIETETPSAVCYDEGEIVKSVAVTTDLFYAGSSYQDSYGNKFVSHDSEYSLILSDETSISEFEVSSDDVKTLVASDIPSKVGVSEMDYIEMVFKSEVSFTSTQKDFFEELSSEAQNEFLMYEFEQFFDSLAGTFKVSVNGKTFYSADDKSKYAYELSGFHSIVEQAEPMSTDAMSEDQETGAEDTVDVESQGSGMSAEVMEDDNAGETMAESAEGDSTETMTSEDTMVDVASDDADTTEEEEVTEPVNQIIFKFTVIVTYLVSADELTATPTFAGKTTCVMDDSDAGEGDNEIGSEETSPSEGSSGEDGEGDEADGEEKDADTTSMPATEPADMMVEDEQMEDQPADEE